MINVGLKDGTLLVCSIYETGEPGEYPITNSGIIHRRFQNHFNEGFIAFQTEMISGKFHPSNVLWYSIENELKMI
jgi:hypothetical protein